MQFKKSLVLPLTLSVVGIFLSVLSFILIQVASKIEHSTTGPSPLAILELVLFVLMLGALSAKRPVFTKVVVIIGIAALVVEAFVVSIVTSVRFQNNSDVTWDSVSFLALGVLCLVSTVLFLVYYLIGRKDTLKKIAVITNLFVIGFYALFAILVAVSSFSGVGYLGILAKDNNPVSFYGIELALLLAGVCVLMGIVLSLQGNLEPKEE